MQVQFDLNQRIAIIQDGEGAGGTGAGLTRPPPARSPRTVLAQLSSEVLDNYNLLQRRSNELAKYQQVRAASSVLTKCRVWRMCFVIYCVGYLAIVKCPTG